MPEDRPGYTDTPKLPRCDYRVHDANRPRPADISPGDSSSDCPSNAPPSDATILFDGNDLDAWESIHGGDVDWNVEDDYLEVEPGADDIRTTDRIADCQLHLEWASPREVAGDGQGRGNSGVFLMDRYEIQVLDCYENTTYADGYAGAVYGQHPPLVNACRPPGEWQTYDIFWTAPQFDSGNIDQPAFVTVVHNGVLIQHHTELFGPTAHQELPTYTPHPAAAPLRLQDHGDRVRFRNIWYRSID